MKAKVLTKKIILTILCIVILISFNIFSVFYYFNFFLNLIFNICGSLLTYIVVSSKYYEFNIDDNKIVICVRSYSSYLEINGKRVEELKVSFETKQNAKWERVINDNNKLVVEIRPINKVSIKLNDEIIKIKTLKQKNPC